jgi:LysM repeat protein
MTRVPRLRHLLPLLMAGMLMSACSLPLPEPPEVDLPTQPAVLEITPAPTLDIDATATVMVSQSRPTPTPAGLYVVQSGDTLSLLADEFNTTVEEILVANDLTDPNDLQVGQELVIPSLLPTPLVGTPAPELGGTAEITSTAEITGTVVITVTQTP